MSICQRLARLLGGQLLLGLGIGLLLLCRLGSDGYSTAVHGVSLATPLPYVAANVLLAAALVLMAWGRGIRPGLGTVSQPVVVGAVVSLLLAQGAAPTTTISRTAVAAAALVVVAVGVVLYVGAGMGAGAVEAAAIAWSDTVGFRYSYSFVQAFGALTGWLLGAEVGIGTLAVAVLVGPLVAVIRRHVPWLTGDRWETRSSEFRPVDARRGVRHARPR